MKTLNRKILQIAFRAGQVSGINEVRRLLDGIKEPNIEYSFEKFLENISPLYDLQFEPEETVTNEVK